MAKLSTDKRNDLPDSEFGIPEKRMYPLNDKAHVESAVKLFGHASDADKPQLARRILAKAKEFGMDSSGWDKVNAWAKKPIPKKNDSDKSSGKSETKHVSESYFTDMMYSDTVTEFDIVMAVADLILEYDKILYTEENAYIQIGDDVILQEQEDFDTFMDEVGYVEEDFVDHEIHSVDEYATGLLPYDQLLMEHSYDADENTIEIDGKTMDAGTLGTQYVRDRMNKFIQEFGSDQLFFADGRSYKETDLEIIEEAVDGLWEQYLRLHDYDPKTNTIIDPQRKPKRVRNDPNDPDSELVPAHDDEWNIIPRRVSAGVIGSSKERNRRNAFLKRHKFDPKTGTIEVDEIDPRTGQKMRVPYVIDTTSDPRYTGSYNPRSDEITQPTRELTRKPRSSEFTLGHETAHLHAHHVGKDKIKRETSTRGKNSKAYHALLSVAEKNDYAMMKIFEELDELEALKKEGKIDDNTYEEKRLELIKKKEELGDRRKQLAELLIEELGEDTSTFDDISVAKDEAMLSDPKFRRAIERTGDRKYKKYLSEDHDAIPEEIYADDYGSELASKHLRGKRPTFRDSSDPSVRRDRLARRREWAYGDTPERIRVGLFGHGIDVPNPARKRLESMTDEEIARRYYPDGLTDDARQQISERALAEDAAKKREIERQRRRLAKETLQSQIDSGQLSPDQIQKAKQKIARIEAYDSKNPPQTTSKPTGIIGSVKQSIADSSEKKDAAAAHKKFQDELTVRKWESAARKQAKDQLRNDIISRTNSMQNNQQQQQSQPQQTQQPEPDVTTTQPQPKTPEEPKPETEYFYFTRFGKSKTVQEHTFQVPSGNDKGFPFECPDHMTRDEHVFFEIISDSNFIQYISDHVIAPYCRDKGFQAKAEQDLVNQVNQGRSDDEKYTSAYDVINDFDHPSYGNLALYPLVKGELMSGNEAFIICDSSCNNPTTQIRVKITLDKTGSVDAQIISPDLGEVYHVDTYDLDFIGKYVDLYKSKTV